MVEGEATEISIAVVQHGEMFLVGQRPDSKPLAGYWEFPGGHVEAGESAQAAAVRECHEETGLRVVVEFEYPDRTHVYKHATTHLRFFKCRPTDGQAAPYCPFRWVTRHDLGTLRFPAGNALLLAELTGQGSE